MQQQITRGDYLEDLITIYIENNLQQGLDDLYDMFVFQCGEIQKQLTPAPVIKISFTEAESKLLTNYNTCYLAGITKDGHKETFNGSISFNTRGEVVYYEPTPNSSLQASTTSTIACPCTGISGVFANCTQPAIKAYFSINYVPTKLSELQNDTDFVDSVDVAESISIHNASTEAHPYIQSLIADNTQAIEYEASVRATETEALEVMINNETSVRAGQTEALSVSIGAETTAREEAVSLAIQTTEAYTDSLVQSATTAINTTIGDLSQLDTSVKTSVTNAINAEVSARQGADNNLQGQIDALAAASDVTDIVGTYAELQAYDTQHLNDNDIIKVLSDETHDDEPSYYRFNKTAGTFSYIGSESAAYTKAQSNSIFVAQTTTVNGKALSSDISLDYADVDALSETYETVITGNTSAIAANTTAIAGNTSVIAQHTTAIASNTTAIATNTSAISTINGKIPTDASTSNKLVSASTLAASIADFANQDLSNLTSNGESRLHALKAYADEGELLTDADGLAFVEKYAHSTFDRSKFTVVGSPNITDDGIASGFSSSNYLTTGLNIVNANNLTFISPIYTVNNVSNSSGYQDIFISSVSTETFFECFIRDNIQLAMRVKQNGTSVLANTQNINLNNNDTIQIKLEFKNNTWTWYGKINGGNWQSYYTANDSTLVNISNPINIGYENTTVYWKGSIDLKQFSITVDGVEVFSGNKTGIDTIKPDDYTVVGTPTISADGIASGLAYNKSANSVSTFNFDNYTKWEVHCRFKTPASWVGTQQSWVGYGDASDSNKHFRLYVFGDANNLTFSWSNGTGLGAGALNTGYSLLPNTIYDVIFGADNTTGKMFVKYKLASSGTYTTIDKDYNNKFTLTCPIQAVLGNGSFYAFKGSIDLNCLKLYGDGNLVYQPCLKIPYTESKTGSKVVNAIYRDRVADMSAQFGYANYYTLSDTDFTLPQVELYGLIGQRTLRDSYRNGINYWELYLNRDLEQGGSCTSGVEVTFARPFADTNYVLSVPYSAKSTTAFTPTQTGDWIAKGKGIL